MAKASTANVIARGVHAISQIDMARRAQRHEGCRPRSCGLAVNPMSTCGARIHARGPSGTASDNPYGEEGGGRGAETTNCVLAQGLRDLEAEADTSWRGGWLLTCLQAGRCHTLHDPFVAGFDRWVRYSLFAVCCSLFAVQLPPLSGWEPTMPAAARAWLCARQQIEGWQSKVDEARMAKESGAAAGGRR